MPRIEKKKNLLVATKATKKKKTKKTKTSPAEYYNCLLTKAQNDWWDPQTGKKKPITACCKECKAQAPILNETRKKELEKLITSYRQVGDSLSKLLKPVER